MGRSPGGGNGNSRQYFCLKNPMDRGARQVSPWGCKEVPPGKPCALVFNLCFQSHRPPCCSSRQFKHLPQGLYLLMSLGHSAFQIAYSLAPVSPPGCVPGYMALWLVDVIHLCLGSNNSLSTTPSLQIKVCPSFRLLPLLFLQSIILC